MLLKSCTSCHVLLSDVFSRSLPLWKEEEKKKKKKKPLQVSAELSQKAAELNLAKKKLVCLFCDAIFLQSHL